jgi:hypothetical protein
MALEKIVTCPNCNYEYNHMQFEDENMFDLSKQPTPERVLDKVMSRCPQCKTDFVIDVSDQYFNG